MAQGADDSRFSAPRQCGVAAGTVGGVGQGNGGSYTVSLDDNLSVEQVQTYTTKPPTPSSYVPSSSEFDFMSSSSAMGSPSGTFFLSFPEYSIIEDS